MLLATCEHAHDQLHTHPPADKVIVSLITLSENTYFTLEAQGELSATTGATFSWEQINTPPGTIPATITNPSSARTRVRAFVENELQELSIRLTVTAGENSETVDYLLKVAQGNIDLDGDGLIEIRSLTMLHNMRYNLFGTGYRKSAASTPLITSNKTDAMLKGDSRGCPGNLCRGYELVADLNFDKDGDGRTWENTGTAEAPAYTLDSGDSQEPYFVIESDGRGGWMPVGTDLSDGNRFSAVFEGNGFTITGLALRRDKDADQAQGFFGLFGTAESASISRIGLIDNLIESLQSTNLGTMGGLLGYADSVQIYDSYTTGHILGSQTSNRIGGLVGQQGSMNSVVLRSYSSGQVHAGNNTTEAKQVGGLIGYFEGRRIIASYSTANVYGSNGFDEIGGLLGVQVRAFSTVVASFATGSVFASGGDSDRAGGLVGNFRDGNIVASYSTGNVDGGTGPSDSVGGLVGLQQDGTIISASYSTGAMLTGGDGNGDQVGLLVGFQNGGSVTASFATGIADGGTGNGDKVHTLIGEVSAGTTTASYGLGSTSNGVTTSGTSGNTLPAAAMGNINLLRSTTAEAEWNSASNLSLGAWDYGRILSPTKPQEAPALNFADYDGVAGSLFHCEGSGIPIPANDSDPTPIAIPNCGTLIPGQR